MSKEDFNCPICESQLKPGEYGSLFACDRCEKGFYVTTRIIDNRHVKVTKNNILVEIQEASLSQALKGSIFKKQGKPMEANEGAFEKEILSSKSD